jgi:tetratricopeptide (TPR) repeat protein
MTSAAASLGALADVLDALDQAVTLAPQDAMALWNRASFRVQIGDAKGALVDLQKALSSSSARGDRQLQASLYYMGAWAYMMSGERTKARGFMNEAAEADPALEGLKPVLEFRLIAEERGPKEAGDYASLVLADPATPPLTVELLSVMTGSKDVRDIHYESDRQRSDYALYLSGYRVERAAEPPEPAAAEASANAPVIVLGTPESVGADESALAVARYAYRDALIKEGVFRVVDSDSRRAAVEELELSLSDASAGTRDQALGQLFAADYVASGSVIKSNAGWLVAYTLSSSKDGTILASEFASAPDHEAIQALAGRFAASLAARAREGQLPCGVAATKL